MPLSLQEIEDFRNDIGDVESPYAFTDAELQRIYTRSSESEAASRVIAIRQLLADAVKLYNYKSAFADVEHGDIADQLKALHDIWAEEASKSNQAHIVGWYSIPPVLRTDPDA